MYETKHKHTVDNEVFFMDNNKVVSGTVRKVLIEIDNKMVFGGTVCEKTTISYVVSYKRGSNPEIHNCTKNEEMLFESKSKLIDSL